MEKPIKQLLEFGILNVDKPSGPTSFAVSDFVRKRLGLRKTSHFGTLDPKVTGVLPIALNRACKLTGYFISHNKEYIGIMRLHEKVEMKKIQRIINKKFLGKIRQTPPVKSRVARREREREIKSFELIEQDGKDILFRVECEGGTYIRKLIDDLGKELGVGAHMLELRRTRAGIFSEDDERFVNLYDFEKAVNEYSEKEKISRVNKSASEASVTGTQNGRDGKASEVLGNEKLLKKIIIPAEEAIKKVYLVVQIKENNLKQILTGKPIYKKDLINDGKFEKEKIVAVFCGAQFVGMYKTTNEKEIFARAEFVMSEVSG